MAGKEVRIIDGGKDAGINRVQWDLRGNPIARGRAGRGTAPAEPQGAPVAAAPNTQPTAANPPATPPATGRQGARPEDVRARPGAPITTGAQGQQAQAGQGREAGPGAETQPPQRGFGRGRGNFGPALPPGAYIVTVTVDGKVIGTKAVSVEADSLER